MKNLLAIVTVKNNALAGDIPSNGKQGNCLPGNRDYVIAVFAVKGA